MTHDEKDGKENKEGGELLNFLLGTMLPTKIKLKNILGTSKDSALKQTFIQTLCLI